MRSWYTAAHMQAHSLYLHIPFCLHRCSYCDFNTYSGMEGLIPAYVSALCQELRLIAKSRPEEIPLHTIFFGGGTPSILPTLEVDRIMTTIMRNFDLMDKAEITIEANPGGLTLDNLKFLNKIGINRLSLGVQTANPQELMLLERQHNFKQVVEAVKLVRRSGIDNLNLDLIYGLPYQSMDSWIRTLDLATSLDPNHFSLYALTVENGTQLGIWVEKGLVSAPDADLAADMYEYACETLADLGYVQYEISNWTRRDLEGHLSACQHNLQYWRNLPYLGCGAGGHGYAAGFRTENEINPQKYIQLLSPSTAASTREFYKFPLTPATKTSTMITREREMKETMLMGLRLVEEGVSKAAFEERFGANIEIVFKNEVEQLIGAGLLEWDDQDAEHLRLTERGYLLGNQVFMQFI